MMMRPTLLAPRIDRIWVPAVAGSLRTGRSTTSWLAWFPRQSRRLRAIEWRLVRIAAAGQPLGQDERTV
jgi:hypothetical protein